MLPSTIADAQPAHMAITCSTSNVLDVPDLHATSGSILSGFLMACLTGPAAAGPHGTKGSPPGSTRGRPGRRRAGRQRLHVPNGREVAYVLPPPAPSTPSGAIRPSQRDGLAFLAPAIARHSALSAS